MQTRFLIRLAAAGLFAAAVLATSPGAALADKGSCSQPISSGADPVATDCLFILRAAVGSSTCAKPCLCQPKGEGPTRATDALLCLFESVGTPTVLDCPCGTPDLEASAFRFDPDTHIADPAIRHRFVSTDYIGAFSQDQDAELGDWTEGWTVQVHGNLTIWHPAAGGTLNGGTPAANGSCPAGTIDAGDTNLPAPFTGTMDLCQLAARYDTAGSTLTLTNDNVYLLASSATSGTTIGDGDGANKHEGNSSNAQLVIEPGTLVLGGNGENLIVSRGAKAFVNGTAADPVVFDGETVFNNWVAGTPGPDGLGTGARRAWGGFIVTGFGPVNRCNNLITCDAVVEGIFGTVRYGGSNADWDAGSIRYAVILNAGFDIDGNGNDTQGLTLYALGVSTDVSYVQVDNSGDDGIEFFGGNVVADHAVLTRNQDDSIDTDLGFRGGVQFALIRQAADRGDKGFEMDNGPNIDTGYQTATPVSLPTIANVTVLMSVTSNAADLTVGIGPRTWTGGNLWNGVLVGAERASIRTEEATVSNRAGSLLDDSDGALEIHNWIVNSPAATNGDFAAATAPDTATVVQDWFLGDPGTNNQVADPGVDLTTGYPNQVP